MLHLLISLSFIAFASLGINRHFRYRNGFDWFLGLFLVCFSMIIFPLTFAGLLGRMNQPYFVLGLQAGNCLIVWFLTRFGTKPQNQLIPFSITRKPQLWCKQPLSVRLFLWGTTAVGFLNVIYTFFVPPNNNDSLTIHLARILMWDKLGSWLPWNTGVLWQVTFPFNAELVSYWTLLFTRRENLMGIFVLISGYLSIFLVYRLARDLVKNDVFAVIASLVWAAMPVVQLNFTSTRHDHVSSLLLLAAIYFFNAHLSIKNRGYLILTGLALGLSIGTNYSVIGYLPGLFIACLYCWLILKRMVLQDVKILTGATIVCSLLFSSAVYLSNQLHFGSPLGPDALEMTSHSSEDIRLPEHIALMTGRWMYQMVDLEQVPQPAYSLLVQVKSWLPQTIYAKTGLTLEKESALLNQHVFSYSERVPFSEDSAWFGWMGAFIFFVVAAHSAFSAFRRREPLPVLGTLLWLTTPLSFAILRNGWTPYDGRYFIPLLAMLCLELADWLETMKPSLSRVFSWVIVVISALTLLASILGNPAKSFWGYRAYWKLFRLDGITAQSQQTKDMVYLVDQTIPLDGRLGIATTDPVYYEYGLYGEHMTRTIIPINPPERLCDPSWLDDQGIQYLLVDYGDTGFPPCSLKIYETIKSMADWMTLKR